MNISEYFKNGLKLGLGFITMLLSKIWNIIKFLFLNKYVRCSLIMLWTVWPVVLIVVTSYLAVNLMEQIRDLLDTLVQDISYSCFALASLFLFGFSTWYATTILFQLKNQEAIAEQHREGSGTKLTEDVTKLKLTLNHLLPPLPEYSLIDTTTLRSFTFLTPIILGLIPFFTMIIATSRIQNSVYHLAIIILLMLLYLAIPYYWRNFSDGEAYDNKGIQGLKYENLRQVHKTLIRVGSILVVVLIVFATFRISNIFISSALGPICMIFLAFTMWMVIASYANFLDYKYQTPFTIICLTLVLLFNNNNHQIRTIETNKITYLGKDPGQTVPKYFLKWIDQLMLDEGQHDARQIPVYLVATEGGGIRSAYWTAAVLNQLNKKNSHFFRHVFAISAVSGGSVGATIFTAQYRDHLRNERFRFDIDEYFKNDFLSPLLTAMLIPDMIQKFSPIGFNELDRARYLEDSWESAYTDLEKQNFGNESDELGTFQPFGTLSEPFMHLWQPLKDGKHFRVPLLFLNSTNVETGRKGLLTNISIKNDSNFANVNDIQEDVYRHLPLKTAASISARFPIVTPPATTQVINEPWKDAANYVDGGYLDNSGTTTLLSILSSITHDKAAIDRLRACNIVIKVITINNSPSMDQTKNIEPVGGIYELQGPLQAFFKSWDNSGDARQYAVKEYLRGFSGSLSKDTVACKTASFIHEIPYPFNLNRKTGIIPLGWDLSLSAESRIRSQADSLKYLLDKKPYSELLVGLPK